MSRGRECPHCGHPLADDVVPGLRLRGQQEVILRTVSRRSPVGISMHDLTSAVYADDPDGGPEHAELVVRTQVFKLNQKLQRHGLRVRGARGPSTSGYALERLDED